MVYDKEKTKTSYDELAPTLQGMIDSKIDYSIFSVMNNTVLDLDRRLNDINVTIGPNRPTIKVEGRSLNLNSQVNILESYHNSTWNRHAVTFK